jgi:hypothetical protein
MYSKYSKKKINCESKSNKTKKLILFAASLFFHLAIFFINNFNFFGITSKILNLIEFRL